MPASISDKSLIELVDVAIGYRDCAILSIETCNYIKTSLDNNEIWFHVQYVDNMEQENVPAPMQTIAKVWHKKCWERSYNCWKLDRIQQARLQQETRSQIEKETAFKEKLRLKGKQPSEIASILERIYAHDLLYFDVGVRNGLIDPTKYKKPVDELLDF